MFFIRNILKKNTWNEPYWNNIEIILHILWLLFIPYFLSLSLFSLFLYLSCCLPLSVFLMSRMKCIIICKLWRYNVWVCVCVFMCVYVVFACVCVCVCVWVRVWIYNNTKDNLFPAIFGFSTHWRTYMQIFCAVVQTYTLNLRQKKVKIESIEGPWWSLDIGIDLEKNENNQNQIYGVFCLGKPFNLT